MALTDLTKRRLAYLLGSVGKATEFNTRITTPAALDAAILPTLVHAMGNRQAATLLVAAVAASSAALTDFTQSRLATAMGSQSAAQGISTELET